MATAPRAARLEHPGGVREIGLRQQEAGLLADGRAQIERAGFTLDYLEARNARTLEPVTTLKDGPVRLLEISDERERFLRHMSHELKTPLASLHEGVAVLVTHAQESLSQVDSIALSGLQTAICAPAGRIARASCNAPKATASATSCAPRPTKSARTP